VRDLREERRRARRRVDRELRHGALQKRQECRQPARLNTRHDGLQLIVGHHDDAQLRPRCDMTLG
jgi:hypothetical protein